MKNREVMPLGIVVERQNIDNRWADYSWRAVAVIPGAPEIDEWKVLRAGQGWVHFHAATLPLEIFRRETEGYRYNLSSTTPAVFVVLREGEEAGEHDVEPMLVTVCPSEAQDYLDSGEEQVDAVPMPPSVREWLAAFVEQHHVDVPFRKRRRRRWDDGERGKDRPPAQRGLRRGYGRG